MNIVPAQITAGEDAFALVKALTEGLESHNQANFEANAVMITGGVIRSIMPKKMKVSRGMLSAELIHRRSRSGRLVMLKTSQSMHSEIANAVALARAMEGSEVT